jgi:hypothetical protein
MEPGAYTEISHPGRRRMMVGHTSGEGSDGFIVGPAVPG